MGLSNSKTTVKGITTPSGILPVGFVFPWGNTPSMVEGASVAVSLGGTPLLLELGRVLLSLLGTRFCERDPFCCVLFSWLVDLFGRGCKKWNWNIKLLADGIELLLFDWFVLFSWLLFCWLIYG